MSTLWANIDATMSAWVRSAAGSSLGSNTLAATIRQSVAVLSIDALICLAYALNIRDRGIIGKPLMETPTPAAMATRTGKCMPCASATGWPGSASSEASESKRRP